MSKQIFLSFCSFLIMVNFGMAQQVQFTGSAKSTVEVGETFNLTYSVNAQAAGFRGPSFTGFDILTGPYTSQSSSIRAINGRTTMSIAYTFTYILRASREGTFEVPEASVMVDNKQYKSNSLTIKVVKSSGGNQGTAESG